MTHSFEDAVELPLVAFVELPEFVVELLDCTETLVLELEGS
jgi:hypothetical protein